MSNLHSVSGLDFGLPSAALQSVISAEHPCSRRE